MRNKISIKINQRNPKNLKNQKKIHHMIILRIVNIALMIMISITVNLKMKRLNRLNKRKPNKNMMMSWPTHL